MARMLQTNQQHGSTAARTQYRQLFAHQAYFLCRNHGYTDPQLAEVLDVSLTTLRAWKKKRAAFRQAIQMGKNEFDQEHLEAALLKCATGFVRKQVTTRTIRQDGQEYTETVEVREEVPGDVRAQIFWLCNRDPQRWRRLSQTVPDAKANEEAKGTCRWSPSQRISIRGGSVCNRKTLDSVHAPQVLS